MQNFIENINATLLYCGKVDNIPEWNYPSHKHDDLHEIVVISDGEGFFTINGKNYIARKGDILIYNKGVLHEEISNNKNPLETYYCAFSFPLDCVEDYAIPPSAEPILVQYANFSHILALIKLLLHESSAQASGYETICHHLLQSIIISIRRTVNTQDTNNQLELNSLPMRIKQYIDTHYAQTITLSELSQLFHVNPYHISHLFKQHFNISPINYAIHRRIGEATQLLVSTELKVWEIAKLLRYENTNYFSIIFKRVTGMSPNQFREKNKKQLYKG